MFKPSLRVLFPEIADRIFLRLPRALLHWAALSSNSVAFLSLGLRGYMLPGVSSRELAPLVVSPRPIFRSPYSFGSWARWGFTTV